MRLATRVPQQAEQRAAATETVNPIVSALAKTQEPTLVQPEQIRLAAKCSSLTQAVPDTLSGTAAKSRRSSYQLLLPTATARRIAS